LFSTRLSETCFILTITERDMTVNIYIDLHVKYSLFLSNFTETWMFSTDFRKILRLQISWKSVQWVPSCSMRTVRQTDETKLIVAFKRKFRVTLLNIEIVVKERWVTVWYCLRGSGWLYTLIHYSGQDAVLFASLNQFFFLRMNEKCTQVYIRGNFYIVILKEFLIENEQKLGFEINCSKYISICICF
jgi:hypothetical protein